MSKNTELFHLLFLIFQTSDNSTHFIAIHSQMYQFTRVSPIVVQKSNKYSKTAPNLFLTISDLILLGNRILFTYYFWFSVNKLLVTINKLEIRRRFKFIFTLLVLDSDDCVLIINHRSVPEVHAWNA